MINLTPKEIAEKYVYGRHDALTDKQEVEDMAKDIDRLVNDRLFQLLNAVKDIKDFLEVPNKIGVRFLGRVRTVIRSLDKIIYPVELVPFNWDKLVEQQENDGIKEKGNEKPKKQA